MILIVDNYDSFTYNLYQLVAEDDPDVTVWRNDAFTLADFDALNPKGVIISPGPGRPEGAGRTLEVIRHLPATTPLLGVCLGHQAIALAFGAEVRHAPTLRHGKTSQISHDGRGVYLGVPDPFTATRYHSLAVPEETLSAELEPTSWADDGVLMGLRHRTRPIEGVQFHPESCLTDAGAQLVRNFLWGYVA